MANAGSWTVSVSKEAMKVPKNFKNLQKLGVQNIMQYSTANMRFPAFFPLTFISSRLICHVYRSVWPAREANPRIGATIIETSF